MVLFLLAWHGVPPGWGEAAELLDGIAAVVNNEIITISEVQEAMAHETEQLQQRYGGQSLPQQVPERFGQTLQGLIDIRLQLERAQKLNLQVSNEDVTFHIEALKKQNQITDEQLGQMLQSRGLTLETYQQQIREGLLITKVVNVEVRSRLIVLDTELQESYQKRRQRYSVPGALTVSHILFLVSPDAPEAEVELARQKATAVLQQLRQGGDFAALARQYSDGPSAERDGLLGTFQPGELLPGFEEAVMALQPGQISDIVRTRVGLHIIRLDARQASTQKSFEEVREELKAELLQAKTESRYQEWLEGLRQSAYVKVLYAG
ncbi:MAG TPA: peptidylprolyl isomerase [Candidatus Tectomicrobia bacterium]|jgi:peptidyl-prolyl cis-trans isomerase SurA